jgi:hypothetical protein
MMVLDWVFDTPNQRLTCKIGDDLEYEAFEGGSKGYRKIYKGVETFISADGNDWRDEKQWISAHFSHLVGVHEENYADPVVIERVPGRKEACINGIGPDGRYLDHLQRLQAILECEDTAEIYHKDSTIFETPDNGKTIFKRTPTRDTNYEDMNDPDRWWTNMGMPCMMQPRAKGYELSSYEEMLEFGVPRGLVDICRVGKWDSPLRPELQKHYIYPTK